MRIGIIGAGHIGGNLGRLWAARGHEIVFGLRDPDGPKARAAVAACEGRARAGEPEEAVIAGELLVLAVPGNLLLDVARGLTGLEGKIVVDPTNRVGALGGASAAEDLARLVPGARVVKAFNTIAAETLLNPVYPDGALTTFVCSDDAAAKAVIMTLASEIGLDAVDAGSLASAGMVEGMGILWLTLSRRYGRDIGYRLLRR